MSRYARSFAALSVITLGVYAVLVTLGLRNLVVGDPPMQPFDLRLLGYSYFEATFYLEHLSEDAIALYAGPLRALDTVFPALMGLWLGWALWGLTRNVHAWSRVILMVVPGGYVIMDLAENALISEMLHHGAGAISEGGFQSMPGMVAPGVALLGCSVGMVNVPRIKGNHNAMLSGKAAAEAAFEAIRADRSGDALTAYEDEVRNGAIGKDLKKVRNVKPMWSKWGLAASMVLGGLDMWTNTAGFSLFGTLGHGKNDADATETADKHKPIDYPKPDGKLSFDRLTNVSFSMTNHEESQPCHLRLGDESIPVKVNLPRYAEPAQRYCPAGVYEIVEEEGKDARFVINFQNCVHCKTCDIKDPSQNITWVTPQGGDGPNYPNM